ncbi:MAG: hypothetical protein JWN67_434 [Actinomycetia bacterium]|nr:hypothetical protein [Actinomycetes bacterium]
MAHPSHGLTDEQLHEMLVESTTRSGVPLYVEDEATLRRLAVLLGPKKGRTPVRTRPGNEPGGPA